MKRKFDIKTLVLGALLGMAIIFSVGAAGERGTTYEYKIITGVVSSFDNTNSLQNRINSNVAEGWQFVSASGAGERYGFAVLRKEKE